MKYKESTLYGLRTKNDVLMLCKISEEDYLNAVTNPYNSYTKLVNGKKRVIEEPNTYLKTIQRKLLEILQELDCPIYCQCGWKGKSNIKNAKAHIKRLETVNFDISHFFPNTKSKYVEQFFQYKLKVTSEALETLVSLTTYNGHVPTGGVTSTIITFLAHKPIFDRIYIKMQGNSISMTLYVDDITLSSEKHIENWVIPYCKQCLKMHGLWLKKTKTRRFGYKGSWVTGVRINQSGGMLVPFHSDYAVIKMLKKKSIDTMDLDELQKLLGKIGYIQQINPQKFSVTKQKAIKRLRKVMKLCDK